MGAIDPSFENKLPIGSMAMHRRPMPSRRSRGNPKTKKLTGYAASAPEPRDFGRGAVPAAQNQDRENFSSGRR